jgi:hypothetical protein
MTKERLTLVAPCGIDCGTCELNMCKDNPQLLDVLVSKGIPKEKIPCNGCRSIQGDCPVIKDKCETYKCVTQKNVEFCFECDEFPCVKLQPSADRANILPHNMKVFNLCTIKREGVENFVLKSTEIKQRYYAGKMEVGNGPQSK